MRGAVYSTVLTSVATSSSDADGHRAAFLAATSLATLGLIVAAAARRA